MAKAQRRVPEGFHTVTPYLIIRDAGKAIEFYKKALGAEEQFRMTDPSSKMIQHAQIKIGDSTIMLADECPEMDALSPATVGHATSSLYLYVEDVDELYKRAESAGMKVLRPLQDMFYGDRSGFLEDPFGHRWGLASHVEDLSEEEILKNRDKMMAKT